MGRFVRGFAGRSGLRIIFVTRLYPRKPAFASCRHATQTSRVPYKFKL